jgi:hypothetical protein
MNRSIKKSISVNELNYIFEKNNVNENERSRLIPALFENPQNEITYLLKKDILTKEDIEGRISVVINRQDCVPAIVNTFFVNDDLVIPRELKEIFFSNMKLAIFVGAGTSKLLGIPLWGDLANEVIDYLQKKII